MVEEQNSLSLIEQANMAAARIEQANMVLLEANATKKLLLEKEEQLQNNRLLGGKTSAGYTEAPKVESPKDYAARVMRGGV
jgi:hypothetical protein